jgi:hypothetical protein
VKASLRRDDVASCNDLPPWAVKGGGLGNKKERVFLRGRSATDLGPEPSPLSLGFLRLGSLHLLRGKPVCSRQNSIPLSSCISGFRGIRKV